MFDTMNPIEIKISLGMLQHEEVRQAINTLVTAMSKAQEAISAKLEQEMREEMRDHPLRGLGNPFAPRRG
jgi:hypothetical protein